MKTYRNSSFSFWGVGWFACTLFVENHPDDDIETRRVLEVTLVGVSVAGSLQ